MGDYKYPYINDKRLYAAVMCACKMIRENGWFNKAVEYAAETYGFEFDKVAEEVRKRQAAGRRASEEEKKERGEKTTYKWFIYCIARASDARVDPLWDTRHLLRVRRSHSADKLKKWLADLTFEWSKREYTGSNYDIYYHSDVYGEYGTKAEAEAHIREAREGYTVVNEKYGGWLLEAKKGEKREDSYGD